MQCFPSYKYLIAFRLVGGVVCGQTCEDCLTMIDGEEGRD